MTFTHEPNAPGGTSLRGYLPPTSYARLIEVFGAPTVTYGDKTQAEWFLRFADGTLATIYDYKEYAPVEAVTDWHVGGYEGTAALERVCEVLGVMPRGR